MSLATKKEKHTPGPWEIGGSTFEDGNEVVAIRSAIEDAQYEDGSGNFKSHVAEVDGMEYAHLIAAAPELLAQLEECRKFLLSYMDGDLVSYDRAKDDDTWPHLLLRDIEIKLAKARGES